MSHFTVTSHIFLRAEEEVGDSIATAITGIVVVTEVHPQALVGTEDLLQMTSVVAQVTFEGDTEVRDCGVNV